MDTFVVILVLLVLLVLFGGAAYFFVRETGWQHARLWLTAPRQFRHLGGSSRGAEPVPEERDRRDAVRGLRLDDTAPVAVALDDTLLRELREELHGELARAAGLTREFDARLTRMEETLRSTQQLPQEVGQSIQQQEARTRRRLERLRIEIHATRATSSHAGQRRTDALAELYGHLARVESALAGVVNPMLLPGEPLVIPDELFDDTLVWTNWNEVGDRAYAFGEVFNQNRFVLDPEIADETETFIATLRQALTGAVYPVLQSDTRSPMQLAQMRSGLEAIIDALPALRRDLETAYRAASEPAVPDDDDDDEDE